MLALSLLRGIKKRVLTMASSPAEPAPAAAPRRGKFLSVPAPPPSSSSAPDASSSSSSSQTRGKFLENTASGSDAGGVVGDASERRDSQHGDLMTTVRKLKIASSSRRMDIELRRRSVLDDLDAAEDVVLALLESASGAAAALSGMTTARLPTTKDRRHGDNNNIRSVGSEGGGGGSFEDLAAKVRRGGAAYSAGVKKLHKLLAPHARYVKSLNDRDGGVASSADYGRRRSDDGPVVAASSGAAAGPEDGGARGGMVGDATSNVYAVRVKRRLAMERCEILRQMIQLEEEDEEVSREEDCENGIVAELPPRNGDAAGSKRKHDSIEY